MENQQATELFARIHQTLDAIQNFQVSQETINHEFRTHLDTLEIHVSRELPNRDNRVNEGMSGRDYSFRRNDNRNIEGTKDGY